MNTLQNNITNSFYTKFYPSLQTFTGSAISTLIIGKLEFWFSYDKYKQGFYKFVEPCDHPLYRRGDSWSEELGVSRKLFAKAFDIIGVRYNSKSAFLKADDKFHGKLYASYHDRRTNQMYFVRNHDFVSQLLERLFSKKKSEVPKQEKNKNRAEPSVEKDIVVETSITEKETSSWVSGCPQGRSWNGDLDRSYARVSSFIHKETSSLEPEQKRSSVKSETLVTEGMIKIWNEEIGELGVAASRGLSTRLYEAFNTLFDRSMDSWTSYCQMISSSKFLMGEAQNKFFKKAWMTWAIRKENISRVLSGEFQLGDRKTNQDRRVENINFEIRQAEARKKGVESKISLIKSEERMRRKKIIKEKIENLTEQEKKTFEEEFKLFLEQKNDAMTQEFKRSGWKGMFMTTYFDGFMEDRLYTEIFETSEEDETQEALKKSGFLEFLENIEGDIAFLYQKRKDLENAKAVWQPQINLDH